MKLFLTCINCCLFLLITTNIGCAQDSTFSPCYTVSKSGSEKLGEINYTFKYYPDKEAAQNKTPQINSGTASNETDAENQLDALKLKYEQYKVAGPSAKPSSAKNTKLSLEEDAEKQSNAIKEIKSKKLESCPTRPDGQFIGLRQNKGGNAELLLSSSAR